MKKRISLLVWPLLAASALAQDAPLQEQQPDVRRYTVEMIIFAYTQDISTGTEIFIPDPPPEEELLPDDGKIDDIPLQIRNSSIDDRLAQAKSNKYELVMIPPEEFTLLDTFEHLRRLDAYEPLMHFGWTQPTYPDEKVPARPLSAFATPPDGLSGELTLYLSRYLHLAIKLQLDAPVAEQPEAITPRNSFNGSDYDFGKNETVTYPLRYRIEEDRIFRNGELRYFDHPKFGALAKITRVEEADPEHDALPDDGEMLGD